MPRLGLVGPAYASQSPNLDAEQCINWYTEVDDGGAGNAPIVLYPTPGTKIFASLLTGGASAGAGTVDNVATNKGFSLTPSVTGTPTQPNETALYIEANGINSSGPGSPTGGPWTFFDAPNGGSFSSMYAKFLTSTATISPSQTLVGIADTWATMLIFFGSRTGSAITKIQSVDFISGNFGAGVHNATFGAPTSLHSGVLVVLATIVTTLPIAPTVTDTNGNIYTVIGSVTNSGGASIVALWAPEVPVGNPTMTFNLGSGNVSGTARAYEVAGVGQVLSGNGPVRGEHFINGRAFAVSGPGFFELFANGTFINRGNVANDALPVTMAASPQQLLLASAGTAYVFDLTLNTLTAIPGATFSGQVSQAGICDGFFLLTIQDSKRFYVSAPLNANDWVTNGSAIVSVFPNNVVSMFVFQRQVWFFSDTQSVVYYDSGNIFPFDVNPNAFIEAGCAAKNSVVQMNNAIFWLGADARGRGKMWMANGYTPTRVSNHAFEFAIQSYGRIDDAVGLSYQDQGHEFYALYFPTPSVMWVFDAATGMLHQRGFWVQSIGQFRAAHYQNHMFAFGKHLVGDWQSGNVYDLHIPVASGSAWDFVTDVGNPIRRVRRAPHVSREQKWQFHTEIQIYVETGLGPIPHLVDGAGNARDPQMVLSWSDDGGHTFGNEYILDCGRAGEFTKRVRKMQLGRARDRVYQIAASDPVPWRIVDGYLQVVQGTGI